MIYIHKVNDNLTVHSYSSVMELVMRKGEYETRVNPHNPWLKELPKKEFFKLFSLMVARENEAFEYLSFYKGKISEIKKAKVIERYPACDYKRREEIFFSNINLDPKRRVEYIRKVRGENFEIITTDTRILTRWGLNIMVSDYNYNMNIPIRLLMWSPNEIKIKNIQKGTVRTLSKSIVL